MALSLEIKVCAATGCESIKITDITNVYSVSNTTGWGTPNIDGSDVTGATLEITNPIGESTTVDVVSEIPNTFTGELEFNEIALYSEDGIYKVKYIIETATETYQTTKSVLLLCKTRCCIDKMWVNLMEKICDTCNYKAEFDNALLAEALYHGLKTQGACINSSFINSTLERLEQLCQINDCNC